jgi:hypothetical protein
MGIYHREKAISVSRAAASSTDVLVATFQSSKELQAKRACWNGIYKDIVKGLN